MRVSRGLNFLNGSLCNTASFPSARARTLWPCWHRAARSLDASLERLTNPESWNYTLVIWTCCNRSWRPPNIRVWCFPVVILVSFCPNLYHISYHIIHTAKLGMCWRHQPNKLWATNKLCWSNMLCGNCMYLVTKVCSSDALKVFFLSISLVGPDLIF